MNCINDIYHFQTGITGKTNIVVISKKIRSLGNADKVTTTTYHKQSSLKNIHMQILCSVRGEPNSKTKTETS